jgi:hypothetical protein
LDDFYKDDEGPQLLSKPFVSFKEVNGKKIVIIETYAHNGSAYNATTYRYFMIGKNLELEPMLTLEARALWGFGDDPSSTGTLIRELKFIDDKTATITTYLQPYTECSPRRLIGSVKIGTSSNDISFKVLEKSKVDDNLLQQVLITTNSDDDEDEFLAKGDETAY